MARLVVVLTLVVSILLVACGGAGAKGEAPTSTSTSDLMPGLVVDAQGLATLAPISTPAPLSVPRPPAEAMERFDVGLVPAIRMEESAPGVLALETVERQVISMASVSIEVEDVQGAVTRVRLIAEGLGGFVDQLSSSGGPDRPRATMTIRVPQKQFFAALEQVKDLGVVQSENVGSEDVTEQFIDLEARLQSSLRQEQSLLSLLERTETVSEILTLERELARVRSEIERLQGQLNFLERRVELATITVTLFPPVEEVPQPPSASLNVVVSDVTRSVEDIRGVVFALGGVVDRISQSGVGVSERASMVLRVLATDFSQVLASVEEEGDVRNKEVIQGSILAEGEAPSSEEPNARIDVSLSRRPSPEPPSASLTVGVVDVAGGVDDLKRLVATLGGVVDSAILSVGDEGDSASVSLRVFSSDFGQALASIESQGEVRSKELREGATPSDGKEVLPDDPDARINVSLVEEAGGSSTALIVAIAAPIGSVALVLLLGLLFYLTYRVGRRRAGTA